MCLLFVVCRVLCVCPLFADCCLVFAVAVAVAVVAAAGLWQLVIFEGCFKSFRVVVGCCLLFVVCCLMFVVCLCCVLFVV